MSNDLLPDEVVGFGPPLTKPMISSLKYLATHDLGHRGDGSPSTFRALERRGLITFVDVGVDEDNVFREVNLYSITSAGRKALADALGGDR
jgi:hypothetical protein